MSVTLSALQDAIKKDRQAIKEEGGISRVKDRKTLSSADNSICQAIFASYYMYNRTLMEEEEGENLRTKVGMEILSVMVRNHPNPEIKQWFRNAGLDF